MKRPILASITPQMHCENIINVAKQMSSGLDTKLYVVTVLPVREDASIRAGKLKVLSAISKNCGVDIIIRYSDNAAESVAAQAAECNPLHIFVGEDNGFIKSFFSIYNHAPVSVVTKQMVFTVPSVGEYKGA